VPRDPAQAGAGDHDRRLHAIQRRRSAAVRHAAFHLELDNAQIAPVASDVRAAWRNAASPVSRPRVMR